MFDRLRKKGMAGIQLDTSGWTLAMDRPELRVWSTQSGDTVEEWHFEVPPDLQAPLTEIGELRRSYREMLDPMAGLIELTPTVIDGVDALRLVFKHRADSEEPAMLYVGSLTVPRRDFSFVINLACPEWPPSGTRDSVVLAQLFRSGGVDIDDEGTISRWFFDPYDPTYHGPVMANVADDAQWDAVFPDHPVSRCRRLLDHIVATTNVADWVRRSAPFEGPQ